jgi:hypothetical protein
MENTPGPSAIFNVLIFPESTSQMSATGRLGTIGPFVNGVPVDVVSGAYDIAANYLRRTGRIPRDIDRHFPLFDSIVEDFRARENEWTDDEFKQLIAIVRRAVGPF